MKLGGYSERQKCGFVKQKVACLKSASAASNQQAIPLLSLSVVLLKMVLADAGRLVRCFFWTPGRLLVLRFLLLVFPGLEIHAKEIVQRPTPTGLVPPHNRLASLLQASRFVRQRSGRGG